MIELIKKTTELNQNVTGVKERLELLETEIPSMVKIPEPKKKFSWGKLAAVITIVLTIVGGGGFFGWYKLYRDSHPVHHKIYWRHHFDKKEYPTEKAYRLGGYIPIREGSTSFPLPLLNMTGHCTVFKENDNLLLQATVGDTNTGTYDTHIGLRVSKGCSEVYVYDREKLGHRVHIKKNRITCCWVSEKD